MMCQHCVAHVNKALSGIEGVEAVEVSLENKNAAVTLAADVSDEMLVKAVVDAGYEVKGVKLYKNSVYIKSRGKILFVPAFLV